MNVSDFKNECMGKKGATADMPFDYKTLVIRVGGKMFALISLDEEPTRVNLKCNPYHAQELRDKYRSIIPGYHMNKRHWNSVYLDGSISDSLIKQMIDESYGLVFDSLSVKARKEITEET